MDWRINYFREASGRSPVESFIDALSTGERVDTMVGIDMLRSHGVSLGRTLGGPARERTLGVENKNTAAAAHPVFSHCGQNVCPATRLCEKDP
ncbi:MAG TPA: hypothetical protein VLJ79_26690 [Candidatus Binatia bacterium]|nr:hypothetical protein [Candidatus Binatia bacterium]